MIETTIAKLLEAATDARDNDEELPVDPIILFYARELELARKEESHT